jgi:transposase
MKKVCGLDVHKDSIFMCILDENGQVILEEFSTLTPDIERMRDLLKEQKVSELAMESTGIYWIPVWRILEGYFDLKLVNPYFIKQLPGRKSDIKDAQWIATVLQKQLIRGSYIPGSIIQELRQYERRYVRLSENITRIEQEIDRHLHRSNIQITNYATKIGSKSVMNVVKAIIDGETKSEELLKQVHGRITNKHKSKIKDSLTGIISNSDRFILKQNYQQWEILNKQQQECMIEMEKLCNKYYKKEIQLLCSIPGIQQLSAMIIISELGVDMKTFVTASMLVGWAGLRPRNDESAGKIKSRKITNGNKYLRRILVQCAWGASRMKTGWLGAKYRSLCKRMSSKKALIAIARKLLVILWNVLSKKQEYLDYTPKTDDKKKQKQIERLEKQLAQIKAA